MQISDSVAPRRLTFDKLRLEHFKRDQCVVLVALTLAGDDVFFGTSGGEDSPGGQLECAANATLRALESAAEHQGGFVLELIESRSQVNAIVVQVAFSEPAGNHTLQLCGSSFVKDTPLHAVVPAVLQTTNRLFETHCSFVH